MTTEIWTKTTIRLEHKGYVGGAERDASGYLQGFVEDLQIALLFMMGMTLRSWPLALSLRLMSTWQIVKPKASPLRHPKL